MTGVKVPRRVVKIGGSLFACSSWMVDIHTLHVDWTWVADVERWLHLQPAATNLVVMGGGEEVDEVAVDQKKDGFSDAEAHWRCIHVMSNHARSLADYVKAWPIVSDPRELDVTGIATTFLLDADGFMQAVDAVLGVRALPESWDVSSDSIAARAAELFAADELVLLKSALPNDIGDLGDYVDPYFPEASHKIPSIRFVNLRDPAFPEVQWR
jgi:aspartokinase-like uncharacterized kinase